MEKGFQMTMSRPTFLQHTLPPCFTSVSIPSTLTTSSFSSHNFNPRFSLASRIVCSYYKPVNEVQVVTGCTWTELVVAADMPVVVEFWAPECGTCRMDDEIAKEYAGKALCYMLNTDEYPNVASQYGIRSIPTILFFKDGEEKESIIGVVPKSTICATLDKYVD